MCPWGQTAAAHALTNRRPNKPRLKTVTLSMWPTCGPAHMAATASSSDPLEGRPDRSGCWTYRSHNIPAGLLTGVSGTLPALFCQRLNQHIRLIIDVCGATREVPPSLRTPSLLSPPKVNLSCVWMRLRDLYWISSQNWAQSHEFKQAAQLNNSANVIPRWLVLVPHCYRVSDVMEDTNTDLNL